MLVIAMTASAELVGQEKQVDTKCYKKVCFPETIVLAGDELVLRGMSEYRYWGFRLYIAGFYTLSKADNYQQIRDELPKKLLIHYLREFKVSDFVESSNKILKRISWIDFNTLAPRLEKFYTFFEPINASERYAIAYHPQLGLELRKNQKTLGLIDDRELAAAYFDIWLSPEGIDKTNARRLLLLEY